MDATRQPRALGFTRGMRIVTALVTMAHLLVAAAAPLAERLDSDVAAIHVEPGGTSAHHAHDDLCATCVALHLLGTPPRESTAALVVRTDSPSAGDQPGGPGWTGLTAQLPRAPPV